MAQEKMPEAGAGAGADLKASAAPGAAYGWTGADRLVLLAKALPSGAGYYPPFAVVRLEDLPEDFRRQIASGGVLGAAASAGGSGVPASAPLRGQGAARHPLVGAGHAGLAEVLRRQLAGGVPPPAYRAGYFAAGAGDDVSFGSSEDLRVLRVKEEEDGRVVYQLDATLGGGLLPDVCYDAAAALASGPEPEPGAPAHGGKNRAGGLGNLDPNDLVPEDETNAGSFVGAMLDNSRGAEQGAVSCFGGLLLAPENAMVDGDGEAFPGLRASPYAVQVSIDPAAGAKAGEPIAPGLGAGEDEARERGHRGGRDNLSAVVGIVAASSAVTAVAAGAVTPAVAFGFFVVLLGGLCLTMAGIRGA